jgi:hypothetical protein
LTSKACLSKFDILKNLNIDIITYFPGFTGIWVKKLFYARQPASWVYFRKKAAVKDAVMELYPYAMFTLTNLDIFLVERAFF